MSPRAPVLHGPIGGRSPTGRPVAGRRGELGSPVAVTRARGKSCWLGNDGVNVGPATPGPLGVPTTGVVTTTGSSPSLAMAVREVETRGRTRPARRQATVQVPGHRAARPTGAHAHPGRRVRQRGATRHDDQAPRRGGDDPGAHCGARAVPVLAARRERRGLRGHPPAPAGDAAGRGSRPGPGDARPERRPPARTRRAQGRTAVGRLGAAGQPVPGPRLHPARAQDPGPPGRLGADRARAERLRAPRPGRLGLHGAAGASGDADAEGPRPDAPPGAAARRRRRGPPHVPPRRRAGARQDRAGTAGRRRSRTPTRCSPSSPTW